MSFDDRAGDWRHDDYAAVEAIDVGFRLQAEQTQRLLVPSDARPGLREIALGLLQRDSRRGLMVEQILRHRGRFLGELEISMALGVFAVCRRCITAADGTERQALSNRVANFHSQIDDLAGE